RQVLKSGRYLRQTRTYGTLVCEVPFRPRRRFATIAPPLPHLFGVHAYITEYADEERISLDLRIHNGHSSGAGAPHPLETPLGLVYFDSLELVLPRGWTALPRVRDPFFGQARLEGDEVVVPLVLPLPARKNGQRPLHMIGPRGQFTRRLELVPLDPTALEESQAPLVGGARGVSGTSGAVGAAGLAFPLARAGLWSWQNPSTANFGPQRTILADWDFYRGPGGRGAGGARSADGKALESLTTLLATGQAGADSVSATVMGWAHPWFRKYQGVTGGFAIDTIGGARVAGSASQDGYRRLELLHRMNTCRQPQALYDWRGEPVGFRQWVNERGLVKVKYRSTVLGSPPSQKLPCLGGPQASVQAKAAVQANRRPEYDLGNGYLAGGAVENTDKNLLAWMPHDGQHLARYTKFAQALAWLGNDALAKDDLLLSAELYRLMVHEGLDPTRPEPEVDGVERDQVEENPEEAGAGLEPREQGAEPELRGPPKPPTPPSPRELARQAKQKEQARERATRAAERIERQESKPWPPPLPLYELEALAHKRRQGGAQVGRELAWGIDATCSAYSLGSPAWRRDSARWFRRLGAALPRLAMPTGIIQRQVNSKFFPDGSHAGAQSFESLLLVHGLRCLDASVFEGQAPGLSEALRSLALRAVDYLFFGPPWQLAAQGEKRGPARAFAVAPADPRDAAFGPAEDGSDWDLPTEAVAPEVETLYGLEALAWAALLSEGIQGSGLDNRFLQRALSYGEGAADLRELAAGVGRRAKPPARDDAGNWAGFLGHLQALGRSE
ncbi:MAG: hypothetical protein QF411_12450, partial [Planctomycetota bacterium]|nr:hypothetical protein [Planctomycetota bacterium]